MKRGLKKYGPLKFGSAVFMILALLWLTISAPFVYAAQQEYARHSKAAQSQSPVSPNDEETCNPFANTTEEKTPSCASFSEEYLHDHHVADCFFLTVPQLYNSEDAGTYIAFHGELLVPPPNLS